MVAALLGRLYHSSVRGAQQYGLGEETPKDEGKRWLVLRFSILRESSLLSCFTCVCQYPTSGYDDGPPTIAAAGKLTHLVPTRRARHFPGANL